MFNDSAPSNIMKRLTRTSNIHTYITRSSTSQLFSVMYSKLKMQRKAFSRVGVEVWNEIPDEYKNLSKKSLKKYRKRALTSQYSRSWRFLNGAWWDNAKIQTQQNWISSTIYVSYHCGQWHETIDAPAVNKTKNNIATLTIEYSLLHTFNNQSVTAPMARSRRKGKGENPYIVNTSRVSWKKSHGL